MKTLYVSDLDGTLLRHSQRTSDFTNKTINSLVEKGMIFSYATARSFETSHRVAEGLNAQMPLIVYNGCFIINNKTRELLYSNYFGEGFDALLDDLISNGVYPITYSYIDGVEKFSYIPEKCSSGLGDFVATRQSDIRHNPVKTVNDLKKGRVFYITCIDSPEKLEPLYNKYKSKYHCIYQVDMYSGEQWLEILPKSATKANAIIELKKILGCDKVVAFGDGVNDVEMFLVADECYAVANAVDELKNLATAVIDSNENDGVAKFLLGLTDGLCC